MAGIPAAAGGRHMKRFFIGLVIGVLGGGAVGFAAAIFIYPFWFLSDPANETLAENAQRTRLAAGLFIHADPSDPVHWGGGGVTLYGEGADRAVVHLHDDFEVGPGPRFHVYLVDRAPVANDADFTAAAKVDLGRLRAFKGSQVFPVPAGVDAARFESVVVWCKEFGVLITPARLTR
jgi:hypothetical protein